MAKSAKAKPKKSVETLIHDESKRKNIPTAEYQAVVQKEQEHPIETRYQRNRDLDPQLVWRGKDEQDWSDLVVNAPPLYIQEKVHPKALIDDLLRQTREIQHEAGKLTPDLFADFNGIPLGVDKTEFYQHDQNWSNRMILGDSLQVMASLAEREGLRGKVQCIYLDPPYGITFNSNFQWSTTSNKVTDGKIDQITREPEQVKAFRDTWRDGIHSYLTYLRDRLTVARDLLSESGSIFVQIGDENVHRVRAVMEEIFGAANAGDLLLVKKKGGQKGRFPEAVNDYIVWYFKNKASAKTKQLFDDFLDESEIARDFRMVRLPSGKDTSIAEIAKAEGNASLLKTKPLILQRERGCRLFKSENSTSGGYRKNQSVNFEYNGRLFDPGLKKGNCWKHTAIDTDNELSGMRRLALADRLYIGKDQIGLVRYFSDFGLQPISNWWDGFGGAPDQIYVVQTNERIVERCLLLTTDPGDLVLDPTCGSGTTATVAEQWGRRWITIDTSRVALALARCRIMGARYPFYLLADSREGQLKEGEVTNKATSSQPVFGSIRQVQREISRRHYAGPARVAGSAGTGKTIVALHRAVFLARAHPQSRVLLTTFSQTLANALSSKLRRLISNDPRLGERIDVHSLDALGVRLYQSRFGQPKLATNTDVSDAIRSASAEVPDHKFRDRFLTTEWKQIVDAWQLDSLEAYQKVSRLGRKTKIPKKQQEILWSIFKRVRKELSARGLITTSELFTKLATTMKEAKHPPFDFAVVDEAQDLTVAHLRFFGALGGDRPNGLFFAGDLGQRIFQQPFSWLELGVDIRGRSQNLNVNYRTSHQIRSQSDRLLDTEMSDLDGNLQDRTGTVSVFNGPAPTVRVFKTEKEEIDGVSDWISERKKQVVVPHEFAIFVRSAAQIHRAEAAAKKAALPFKILDEKVEPVGANGSLSTMHLAKGLEFRAVIVMACDDEVLPSQERIGSIGDDADLQEVYDTERHLLYVASTRARDFLLIAGVEPASEFLDDLRTKTP